MKRRHIERDKKNLYKTINYLKKKKKILFLTTSNRWEGHKEKSKSTKLAYKIAKKIGKKTNVLEIPTLNIYPCEGNVSGMSGNHCGPLGAKLKNSYKNPSGNHRCWASINNPDDELWKVSKPLLGSDCVIIFGSVRWGQMNSFYQKLIERMTWLENRHTTLQGENLLKDIEIGLIVIGHNWNGVNILKTQKQVLKFFGFKVVNDLCWNWDFTTPKDETNESYLAAAKEFKDIFLE